MSISQISQAIDYIRNLDDLKNNERFKIAVNILYNINSTIKNKVIYTTDERNKTISITEYGAKVIYQVLSN